MDERTQYAINEAVRQSIAETKPTTANEKILSGGLTLLGIMGICVAVSLACWAIISIWRAALT